MVQTAGIAAGRPDAAETRDLWARFVASRDEALRTRLIDCYLPFARLVAVKLYRLRADDSIPFDDYLQYARIGLLEAMDRYDPAREASFETFARHRIRGAVLNGMGKESELLAQRSYWRARTQERVESLKSQAFAGSGDLESFSQLIVGLALGFLLEQDPEPADESLHANPYAANEMAELCHAVRCLVDKLPEREQDIISLHYFQDREFQVIARELGISKGRISQLHAQALGRIRKLLAVSSGLDRKL